MVQNLLALIFITERNNVLKCIKGLANGVKETQKREFTELIAINGRCLSTGIFVHGGLIAQRATGLAERWRDELGVGLYLFGVGPRRQGWPLGWLIALGKPRVGRLQLVDHSDVGLALGALDGVAFEVAYVT
jgi:hypothetical protein